MTIGYRIQQLRKEMGMTQENLASSLNVSRQAVSKWESDQSLPDLDNIILLSEYLNTTTDYLLKGTPTTTLKEEPSIGAEPMSVKQESAIYSKLSPTTLLLVTTAINLIGFLVFSVYSYDGSSIIGPLIGVILMILSSAFFGIQIHTMDPMVKYMTKRKLGLINVWFLSFPPIIFLVSRWFSLISYLIFDKLIRMKFASLIFQRKELAYVSRSSITFPLFCYITFCIIYCIISSIYYKRKIKKANHNK